MGAHARGALPLLGTLKEDLSALEEEARPLLWLSPRLGWVPEYGNDLTAAPVLLELADLKEGDPWPAERWQPPALAGVKVEPVALSHVTRFLSAVLSLLNQQVPPLGPATGERQVVATEGAGRLEVHDGTKVLFLKGAREEVGRQQGVLMKRQARNLVDKIL